METRATRTHRGVAETFAARLKAAVGDQIDAIVLYGSVARGEAKRSSDVDILLVSSEPRGIAETVSEVRSLVVDQGDYRSLISLIHFDAAEFRRLTGMRTPFMTEVLAQGIALHDNGTFERARSRIPAGG